MNEVINMTVKELKDLINNIDSKYDNEEVLTDNKDYNEYCLGSSVIKLTALDMWHTDCFNNNKGGFYIELMTD